MTQSFPDPAERLVKRERLFVWLRYGALALFAALLAVNPQEPALTPTTLSVIGAGFVLNTLIWPALYVRRLAKALAAVSAAGDALFLLYFLISSGGGHSPLWSFVFVLIAAMSLRFGTVGGVGTAVVFGALTLVYGMGASDTAPVTLYQSVVRALSFVTLAVVVGWLLRHEHAHTLEEVEEARQAVQRSQSDVAGFAMLSGTISANTSYSLALEQALDLSLRGLRVRGQGEQDALGFILLFDPNDQETLFVAVHRNLDASDAARRFTRVRGQLKTVLETGEPAIVTDTSREPVLAGLTASKTYPTMVIMPLRAGFTLFGVAIIGGPAGMPEAYSNRRELLAVYCAQAGIALQSAQLYEQLRQERDRIVDSEEKARHELARDLHDGPVNAVASLTMGLDFARRLLAESPAEAKQEIDSLYQLAAKTAREMRMTMYRLRPLALESAGLTAALDQYLSRLQAERAQPQFHLLAPDAADFEPRLSSNAATMVFDIVKEAIGNSLKYAEARNVNITLRAINNWLAASISDDGKGFDLAAVQANYNTRGSLGMINIQERAALAQGDAAIESAPGRGTTVTVRVPLAEKKI